MGEERDAYVEKMKARIDEWNDEIDKLQAQADQAQADIRTTYLKHLIQLKSKRQVLKEKMDELHQAGEGAWEDMKKGVEMAQEILSESLHAAKSRFS
jgi:hypothetical protein